VGVAYIRTVRTASNATAVQIVYSSRKGSRDIEHIGSAHTAEDVEVLKAVARQRLHANQDSLDFGDGRPRGAALPILATRSQHLWDALQAGYRVLGFDAACDHDEVFQALVLARAVEPTSKLEAIRVLKEIGITAPSYPTINRRLPSYATQQWRQRLAAACAAHVGLGPATLVIYDVTTLYFETDEGDGFREPGFSKERRLEPQITVGLLTDARGFPLMINAFEGNKAETKTILPVIGAFAAAHQIPEVTVVADAGMLSEANLAELEDAGLRFIVGARIPEVPYQVAAWRRAHPDEPIPDGQVFTQPWVMGTKTNPRKRTIFYQYRADRARRALRGIDQQIMKAERAVAGQIPVKRNRFVQLTGGTKSINRGLETKARALAGLTGYITNLEAPTAEYVMAAYHQLWQIEKSFRMSKSDLRARPIYHHKRDSIEAHLTIVFAALAVTRWLERQTGWSTKKFITALRRYHTIDIQAGDQIVTAEDPLPDDIRTILDLLHGREHRTN
jgi:Transposase DDE domain